MVGLMGSLFKDKITSFSNLIIGFILNSNIILTINPCDVGDGGITCATLPYKHDVQWKLARSIILTYLFEKYKTFHCI